MKGRKKFTSWSVGEYSVIMFIKEDGKLSFKKGVEYHAALIIKKDEIYAELDNGKKIDGKLFCLFDFYE